MLSKKSLIEIAFGGLPYDEIRELMNIDNFIFVSSMKKKFPDFEILEDENDFINEYGLRFRPKMLNALKDNNGWKPSGYHDNLTNKKNPFIEDEYYHIGFLSRAGNFSYQGIKKYNEGFFDDDRYPLRPFPTHYIHIKKPLDAIHS